MLLSLLNYFTQHEDLEGGSRGLSEFTVLAFIYRNCSQTWGVRWWAIPFLEVEGMPDFSYFPVMLE
jgi:hypothetical protein